MSARRLVVKGLLFLIEGPATAWWAPVLMVVIGFVLILYLTPVSVAIGVTLLALGLGWTCSRIWQYKYYRSIAEGGAPTHCIRCSYPLKGLESDICPECGCSQNAEREYAARVAGNPPPLLRELSGREQGEARFEECGDDPRGP